MTDSTRQKWIDAGLEDSYQELLDRDGISKSEGWSLEQKEAIRAELALLMGLSSVAFREEVDGDLVKSLINKTMLAVEAITKGEE